MGNSPTHTIAGSPLLETKLFIPKPRPELISRQRLVDQLRQGIERKLTLVSAPAGFGKTTLLAASFAPATETAINQTTGWVSLDAKDNNPSLFWAYVIAALQTIKKDIGETLTPLLFSPQPPPIESILTLLSNEINACEEKIILVLDDYHVINAEPIHTALAFLLDHLPRQMHLVIASRRDPDLPLARLRARGESSEFRAEDLRFLPEEAATFLNKSMGFDLSASDVSTLEARTEGWIAGLQLAALSMRGRKDVSGFIDAFAGDDRHIVDYLIEEVLQQLPEHNRSFLLQTSILEKLSGPLCNAITQQNNGQQVLETLERENLFLIPLDDKRLWYRYHHLFAEMLRGHLEKEQPERVSVLHQRVSSWCEENGMQSTAIHHAMAAKDFDQLARLLELVWPEMDERLQSATWLDWVKMLPDEMIRARPLLSAGYAWALLDGGELEASKARLQDAERWLNDDTGSTAEMIVVDQNQFNALPASIALAHTYFAQSIGDLNSTEQFAKQALALTPEEDDFGRGKAAALLGLAQWASGDLNAAHISIAEGLASMRKSGHEMLTIGPTFVLADIRTAQGRIQEAINIYEQSIKRANERKETVIIGLADLHVGLSELLCERGDIEAAKEHLSISSEMDKHAKLPTNGYRWFAAMAGVQRSAGNLDAALKNIDEAARLFIRSPIPDLKPVSAFRTQIWIAQGRLAEALNWARESNLAYDDELTYFREFEHMTLARTLIAWYRSNEVSTVIKEAEQLLERLLTAAENGGRYGSVIEILLLQSLAFHAQNDISSALKPLEKAMNLAEPEGYIQLFTGEGSAMRDLLRHATTQGIAGAYSRKLLLTFEQPTKPTARASTDRFATPLTGREIEILRLIAGGMRNQEIADHLFISLSTVKRHIANIYGKLDVTHRTEAVALATERKLL